MEEATRRYILRILALHVLLLAVVAGVTLYGAYSIHETAQARAEADAGERQRLLARQTIGGIAGHFDAIVSTLDLRDPDGGPGPFDPDEVAPVLWDQLRGRVDALAVLDADGASTVLPPDPGVRDATLATLAAAGVFEQAARPPEPDESGVPDPLAGVFATRPLPVSGGEGDRLRLASVVVVPAGNGRSLAAVVPLAKLRTRYLGDFDNDATSDALLVDQDGLILSAGRANMTGRNVREVVQDSPSIGEVMARVEGAAQAGIVVRDARTLAGEPLADALLTIQPVPLPGQRWSLIVQQPLAGVSELVGDTFWGVVRWATFVIIAATAVLLSTGVSAIRGRRKLERLRAEVAERELAQLDEELENARQIQMGWLPEPWDGSHRLEISAVNAPASHISGDFYDWFALPGRDGEKDESKVVVTIGDVTGHGMAAAFLMATTQLLVRTTMQRVADPAAALTEVNRQLARQVYGGQFVTLLVCVIDLDAHSIEMACAGHHPPLACANRGYEELPVDSGLVLGVMDDVEYELARHELPEGCRSVLLYTDGVIEAANPAGERYSTQALAAELPCEPGGADEIARATRQAVERFADGVPFEDDVTTVAVYLRPDPHPAAGDVPDAAQRAGDLRASA